MDALNWYIENRSIYKRLAFKVEGILTEIFEMESIPFHIIQSRAKEIESFKNKISGEKYSDPINQIQDFAGIRVITYVEDEVKKVCEIIENTFEIDVTNSTDKSESLGIDKVGYKSVHYVATLKKDRLKLPENEQFKDKCFEIQIRTILQHAWAEIEHDRNYKFSGILPKDVSRRFKLVAGTLELADREFNRISNDIDQISANVKDQTKKGNLDIELNSTSFSEYFQNRFNKIVEALYITGLQDDKVIKELNSFGINTLEDFNKIIPKKFEEQIVKNTDSNKELWVGALVRMIMIINDYDKFFKSVYDGQWNRWSNDRYGKPIFDYYKTDWDIINEKYNVPFTTEENPKS